MAFIESQVTKPRIECPVARTSCLPDFSRILLTRYAQFVRSPGKIMPLHGERVLRLDFYSSHPVLRASGVGESLVVLLCVILAHPELYRLLAMHAAVVDVLSPGRGRGRWFRGRREVFSDIQALFRRRCKLRFFPGSHLRIYVQHLFYEFPSEALLEVGPQLLYQLLLLFGVLLFVDQLEKLRGSVPAQLLHPLLQ